MSKYESNIRDHIGYLIGKRVLDISQHDPEDYDQETGTGGFVHMLFEDGSWIRFYFGTEAGECDFEHSEG